MTTAAAFLPHAAPPLHHHHHLLPPPLSPATISGSCRGGGGVGGRKHAERLLSSLDSFSGAEHPAAAADRLVRRFLASSSNSAALHTLSHLLFASTSTSSSSHHHLVLPLFRRLRSSPWFRYNPKLAASVVPLMDKLGTPAEAEALISEVASSLNPREVTAFYCDLVVSYARHGSAEKVLEFRSHLRALHLGKAGYRSVSLALCLLELPGEAEEVMGEMARSGFRPSPFEYRTLAQCYGRLGRFPEMRRVLRAMVAAGCEVDTVCANMVISCYGGAGKLPEMVEWLGKIRVSGIPFSIRTYNSVLNSCPRLCSMLGNPQDLPLSFDELVGQLEEGGCAPLEALLVRELVRSSVLVEMLKWSAEEGKLDLHGCHLGSAFVVVLQWVDELKARLISGGVGGRHAPVEISIVCGSGKHSGTAGESPVKRLVCEMMFRMESPLRIDRKNVGRLVARAMVVREWLMKMEGF